MFSDNCNVIVNFCPLSDDRTSEADMLSIANSSANAVCTAAKEREMAVTVVAQARIFGSSSSPAFGYIPELFEVRNVNLIGRVTNSSSMVLYSSVMITISSSILVTFPQFVPM